MEYKYYLTDEIVLESSPYGDIIITHLNFQRDNTVGGYKFMISKRAAIELASFIVNTVEADSGELEESVVEKIKFTKNLLLRKRKIQLEDKDE